MNKISRLLISKRTIILAIHGGIIHVSNSYLRVSLLYIVLFGIFTGVTVAKVFCRWMYPLGLLKEMLMGRKGSSHFSNMYQFHILGCLILWASGFLNKWSVFKIKLNTDTCKSCGLCDKECFTSTFEPAKYSMYKVGKQNPALSYSCSKCFKCLAVYPNGNLKYNTQFRK